MRVRRPTRVAPLGVIANRTVIQWVRASSPSRAPHNLQERDLAIGFRVAQSGAHLTMALQSTFRLRAAAESTTNITAGKELDT